MSNCPNRTVYNEDVTLSADISLSTCTCTCSRNYVTCTIVYCMYCTQQLTCNSCCLSSDLKLVNSSLRTNCIAIRNTREIYQHYRLVHNNS